MNGSPPPIKEGKVPIRCAVCNRKHVTAVFQDETNCLVNIPPDYVLQLIENATEGAGHKCLALVFVCKEHGL